MYVIVWEYRVKADKQSEFEAAYSSNGAWVELFKRSAGFISVELLREDTDPQHYLTIDRWRSRAGYEEFLSCWQEEYRAVDALCENMTEWEALIGKWGYT